MIDRTPIVGMLIILVTTVLCACYATTPAPTFTLAFPAEPETPVLPANTPVPPTHTSTSTPVPPAATATPFPLPTLQPTSPPTACDKLAFSNNKGIHLVNPDGSDLEHLVDPLPTDLPLINLYWSPDGHWLVYKDSADYRGHILNVEGTVRKTLLSEGGTWRDSFEWSPDSQYVLRVTGTSTIAVFTVIHVETGQIVCDFTVSNGSSAFYEPVDCDPIELSNGRWWYLRDNVILDEYEQRWVFWPTYEGQHFIGFPTLSPNGKWVIFNGKDILVAQTNGKVVRPFPNIPEGHKFCDATWFKDSERFAFVTYKDGQVYIWTATINDDFGSLITKFPSEECGHWSWSANGRYLSFPDSDFQYVIDWVDNQVYNVGAGGYHARWSSKANYLLVSITPLSVWDAEADQTISVDNEFESCGWSPKGYWLVCSQESAVMAFNPAEGDQIHVDVSPDVVRPERTVWSPTERWLAVLTTEGSIYTIDVATDQTVQITGQGVSFVWSPVCGSN